MSLKYTITEDIIKENVLLQAVIFFSLFIDIFSSSLSPDTNFASWKPLKASADSDWLHFTSWNVLSKRLKVAFYLFIFCFMYDKKKTHTKS